MGIFGTSDKLGITFFVVSKGAGVLWLICLFDVGYGFGSQNAGSSYPVEVVESDVAESNLSETLDVCNSIYF